MKSIVCTSLFVMVLVSAHRFAGPDHSGNKKVPSTSFKNAIIKYDTFYAVRIIRAGNPPKTAVKDTIVLVMHNMPDAPPSKKAGTNYNFEMIPYNPFDSGAPSKSAVRDTVIWTAKPYRP